MSALAEKPTVFISTCDQCGSSDVIHALSADPWTLMRCEHCDFVFTSPRLSDDALARIYADEYYEQADDYAAQQIEAPSADHLRLAARARRMLSRRPGSLTSVDVGCGGGRLVEAFAENGFRASGVEPSEGTVRSAQRAGRAVTNTDVADLPDACFDCVTAIHVLEHVTAPSAFMADLFRITRPGGLCIIEVPNFGSRAARAQGAAWSALHPGTHLSHFTPGTLAACMQKAGYSVRSLHRLGGAGVFAGVADVSSGRKTVAGVAAADRGHQTRHSILKKAWAARSTIMAIPFVRAFARWVNWEVLGHGEYVRAFAVRPAQRV
ncbi:MAG: class I SAM-dependent methyltransferase [Fuerstiella sp.]